MMGVRHVNVSPGGVRGGKRSMLHRVEMALVACERRPLSRGQVDLCSAVYELLLLTRSRSFRSQGGTRG